MAKVLIEVSDEMYLACVNDDEFHQDRVTLAAAIRNGKRIYDPRPLLVLEHGEVYLESIYIDAMLRVDERRSFAEALNRAFKNIDGKEKYDLSKFTIHDYEREFPGIGALRYDGDANIIYEHINKFGYPLDGLEVDNGGNT